MGVGAERLWVTEPYLAGARRVFQVLEDAARDGVDVRLLMPGASDVPMVRNLSRTGYKRLLRAGVRLWEWGGAMLHAKTMTVDGLVANVGSANFDSRSLVLDDEVNLVVFDPDVVAVLDRHFDDDLARSEPVVPGEWDDRTIVQRAKEAVAGLVDEHL